MLNFFKRFWTEEDGMTAIEMVVIIAVLLVVAIIFKDGITKFAHDLIAKFFVVPEIKDTTPAAPATP